MIASPAQLVLSLILLLSGCAPPLSEGTYVVESTAVEADGCTDSSDEWGIGETAEYEVTWPDTETVSVHSFEDGLDIELTFDGEKTLSFEGTATVAFTDGCSTDSRIRLDWTIVSSGSFDGQWQFDMEGVASDECEGVIESSGCQAVLAVAGALKEDLL